ncbi:MAG TPA: hypothetical protein VGF45_11710 [Polyangia bacterium]
MEDRSERRYGRARAVGFAVVFACAAAVPVVLKQQASTNLETRVTEVASLAATSTCLAPIAVSAITIDTHEALASWQTIGGCGAGGSGSGGSSIKWVGRNVSGGLFNVIQTSGYTHLYTDPNSQEFRSGFNFSSTTQVSSDITERWNAGVAIPYLYKVYRDFKPNPQLPKKKDIANRGVGDVSFLLVRKFGAIKDTIATLSLGLPTGTYTEKLDGSSLSQETQLGFGKPNASLTIDHVLDEIWGLFVIGGNASYRGGRNDLESYRAPSASLYSYVGFFSGPLVPSFGLTLTGFQKHDQDVNVDQNTPLVTLAPSVAVEWSNDYVALLLGGSLPFGTSLNGKYAKMPWVASLGVSVSPF